MIELTQEQQDAKAAAERYFAGKRELVHLEAARAMSRAYHAAPADATREQILIAAIYGLAEQAVDTSPLLPKQHPEKGSG